MSELLKYALFALACPIGMGLMMFFMNRGMRGKSDEHSKMHGMSGTNPPSLAQLEAEKLALERQISLARNNEQVGIKPKG